MLEKDWKTTRSGRDVLSLEFTATDWYADIDSRDFLAIVMDRVLAFISKNVKAGIKPGGVGRQDPLGDWIYTDDAKTNLRRDVKARKSMFRGYATGVFADGLTRKKISGNAGRARTSIAPPKERAFWFAREAQRGNLYLSAKGGVLKLAIKVARDYIQAAVDAGEGTFETAALAAARKARDVKRKKPRRKGGVRRRGSRSRL